MKTYRILAINPGSTSTKLGLFDNEDLIFEKSISHSVDDLKTFDKIYDQLDFRKEIIFKELKDEGYDINDLDCVVGRGGLLKPIEGGTYEVNDLMLDHLKIGYQGQHASNLGGLLANEIVAHLSCKSYIVDPVVVDELEDVARISGLKEIERISIFHALNQTAIARRHASSIDKSYEDLNLIVVHLGGGISVGAHRKGRVIECANALDGEGPFSPERSGGLPVGSLIKLCYSGKYTYEQVKKMITGNGGMVSYLGTNDGRQVSEMIAHDNERARLIYEAMAYQVSKEIASVSAVLHGDVDAILLTGGLAFDTMFTDWIVDRVKFISDVHIYPGEDELEALAEGGLRVLRGQEEAKVYK